MQVVSLKIKNFLSITDAEIVPGKINQIIGNNNQGKTSIIKALQFVAEGSRDASLVRQGADAAEVIIELQDGTVARRRLSALGAQTVSVKKDGMTATSPQAHLDGLFKSTAFNPLEVLGSKNRTETILKTIDLKVTSKMIADELGLKAESMPPVDETQHGLKVIEQVGTYFFQRRAEANKVTADKKKRYEIAEGDLPKEVKAPARSKDQIKSAGDAIHAEIGKLEEKKNEFIRVGQQVETKQSSMKSISEQIYQHTIRISDLEKKLIEERANLKAKEDAHKIIVDELAELRKVANQAPDVSAQIHDRNLKLADLRTEYQEHQTHEQIMKRFDDVKVLKNEFLEAQSYAEHLDDMVTKVRERVAKKIMETVDMPIKGLTFVDGNFLLDGISIDNLSSSKSIKLSVAIARKLSAKSKIICIDGAEQLDDNTYSEFKKEITDDGYTYFITKVGDAFNSPGDNVIEMKSGAVVQ